MTKRPPLHPSKSRYVAGIQCPKMLWWRVPDTGAAELTVDPATQNIFDRGSRVGELARTHVPGRPIAGLMRFAQSASSTNPLSSRAQWMGASVASMRSSSSGPSSSAEKMSTGVRWWIATNVATLDSRCTGCI